MKHQKGETYTHNQWIKFVVGWKGEIITEFSPGLSPILEAGGEYCPMNLFGSNEIPEQHGQYIWTGSHIYSGDPNEPDEEFVGKIEPYVERGKPELSTPGQPTGFTPIELDLAALVRRLCWKISNWPITGVPENDVRRAGAAKLTEQAQYYLQRKGLQGSILREGSSE
jgi:hypothetical protein